MILTSDRTRDLQEPSGIAEAINWAPALELLGAGKRDGMAAALP